MVHAGYLEQFPTAGLTGKYTCVEDFYLRAREDAYLAGGIENGMIVAGHTPTLSKDYMMYNGGLVYQHYDPQKNCLYRLRLLLPYYSGKRAAGVPVCGNRSDLLLVKNVQIV